MWRSQLAAAAEAAGAAALADGEEAVARLGSDAVVAVRAGAGKASRREGRARGERERVRLHAYGAR